MSSRTLVVFDFDHSLIPDNSDTWLLSKFGVVLTPSIRKEVETTHGVVGWTALMDHFLSQAPIHDEDELFRQLETLTFEQAMHESVCALSAKGHEVIIVSDANSLFINCVLQREHLQNCFAGVFTNPAYFDDESRLRVLPTHKNDTCTLCPSNLCKG
jgi:pyridoxal phosphate phosphatase PHOSPHO2